MVLAADAADVDTLESERMSRDMDVLLGGERSAVASRARELAALLKWGVLSVLLSMGFALSAEAQTIVEYIHTDALGSPVATTDVSGSVVERQVYEPYGAAITHGSSDRPGFAGHVTDSSTGLTYMQQRYYDSALGIFLSADPVPAQKGVVAFNRFRYAQGNPFRFVDPDGRAAIVRRMKDGSIEVKVPVKFVGGDQKFVDQVKQGVAEAFSGTYKVDGKDVKVNVSLVEVTKDTPRRARNEIKLVSGPTSNASGQGASFVTANTRGGEWNILSIGHGEDRHEVGHLLGMEDQYTAWYDGGVRKSSPNPGYENNLMGRLGKGAAIDSRNVAEMMSSRFNVFEEEK